MIVVTSTYNLLAKAGYTAVPTNRGARGTTLPCVESMEETKPCGKVAAAEYRANSSVTIDSVAWKSILNTWPLTYSVIWKYPRTTAREIQFGEWRPLDKVIGVSGYFPYHLPWKEKGDSHPPHLKSKEPIAELGLRPPEFEKALTSCLSHSKAIS